MFHFLTNLPFQACMHRIYDVADLQAAFEEFAEAAWGDDLQPAVAVWNDNFLVGQVLPVYNPATGEYEPRLYAIPPP